MMSKHTPGPWNIYIGEGERPISIYQDDRRRKSIASFHVMVVKTPDDETQANARLIAAAPTMLEALVGLSRAYVSLCEETGKEHHKVNGSWVSHARAAIAAAKGESP